MVASNILNDAHEISGIPHNTPPSPNQIDLGGIWRILARHKWVLQIFLNHFMVTFPVDHPHAKWALNLVTVRPLRLCSFLEQSLKSVCSS